MLISKNKVVSLAYVLKDDAGDILDSSAEGEPLVYVQGRGNIIPGLEKQLEGRSAGESFSALVSPEEAYGIHRDELVARIPRAQFGEAAGELEIGMEFEAHGPEGIRLVRITGIDGDAITIDANHPLAGQTLHFEISIVNVRDASPEELELGHVHSSCGCGSCGEGCGEGEEDGCGCGGCH